MTKLSDKLLDRLHFALVLLVAFLLGLLIVYLFFPRPIIIVYLPPGVSAKATLGNASPNFANYAQFTSTLVAVLAVAVSCGTLLFAIRERSAPMRTALASKRLETYCDIYSDMVILVQGTSRAASSVAISAQQELDGKVEESQKSIDAAKKQTKDVHDKAQEFTVKYGYVNVIASNDTALALEDFIKAEREALEAMILVLRDPKSPGLREEIEKLGTTSKAWLKSARSEMGVRPLDKEIATILGPSDLDP